MVARPVRISLDDEVLARIDEDPEAREKGRSAFIRAAIESYFTDRERREIEGRLLRVYSGQADAMRAEVEDLLSPRA